MLKGQEGNILPSLSHAAAVYCPGGNARWLWPVLPFPDWGEAIHVPSLKPSPHLIETQRHKGHSLPGPQLLASMQSAQVPGADS